MQSTSKRRGGKSPWIWMSDAKSGLDRILHNQEGESVMESKREAVSSVLVAIPATISPPRGVKGDNLAVLSAELQMLTALEPERRSRGHWINLHSSRLEKLLGKRYRDTILLAKREGIIDVNGRYSTGRNNVGPFSKSYRLTTQHRHSRSRLFRVDSKNTLRRIKANYSPDPINLGVAGMHYYRQFEQFYLDPAVIDSKFLASHWDAWAIARFLNRQEFAVRCEYRRYHSLLTQLPRKARKHLRCKQKDSLTLIDVSSCQPLLLGLLASNHPSPHSTGPLLLPYVPRFWRRSAPNDVQDWIDLCESKGLYQYLHQRIRDLAQRSHISVPVNCGRKSVDIDLRSLTTARFKRAFLIFIFDRLASTLKHPLFHLIESEFPNIATCIVRVKQAGHQRLACICQRMEAGLMIDAVGGILAKQHGSEPVQPIHDALVVRNAFAGRASEIIRESFGLYDLRPHLTVEELTPETVERAKAFGL